MPDSVVSLFNEIGFTTHWLSTQQRDQYTGAVNRYSSEASDVRFLDRQYDLELVELLKRSAPNTDPNGKHFFLLHTQGSHGMLEDRCPPEQRRFPVGPGLAEHEHLINSYDNSIVYTDFVLSELIALLKQRPGITAMLYVADHGENLKDDDRGLLGHFFNNEYDLPVPMVFWYSERFAGLFPEKVEALKQNAAKRASTSSIFIHPRGSGAGRAARPQDVDLQPAQPSLPDRSSAGAPSLGVARSGSVDRLRRAVWQDCGREKRPDTSAALSRPGASPPGLAGPRRALHLLCRLLTTRPTPCRLPRFGLAPALGLPQK